MKKIIAALIFAASFNALALTTTLSSLHFPESYVSNLVEDLASVPVVANDEFFDFNAPITNTPYYNLFAFQGIAFSTGNFYGESAELYKYSLTGTLLVNNATPFVGLPGGIDHLGGMDFYSNALYSAACYFNINTFPYTSSNSVIAIYSTNDLSLISYFSVTNWMPDVSGVAIDAGANIIYAASFIDTTNLFEFSLTNHAFLGTVPLVNGINGIQGLHLIGNMLVVSGHLQPNVPEIWFFDKNSGAEVSPPQYLPELGEIEDVSTYQSNLMVMVGGRNYMFVPTLTTNLTSRFGASGFTGKNLLLNSVSSVSSVLSRDPVDDGLVLCYHFDETGGQLVHDSSRSGNNGWVTTNSILGNAGVAGYGALFSTNAAAFYVNDAMVANPDHITGLTNLTINLWANSPTNFSSIRALINKHWENAYGEWFILANSCTNLQFSLIDAAENRVNLSCNFPAGTAFTNNVWHMVTATYDGSTMNLYLDAKLIGSANQTGVIQAIPGLQLQVGCFGDTEVWNGGIDEVKIWSRAIKTNEISMLYNQISNNKNFSSITGDGGGLANLTATNLSGTIPLGNLDPSVLTNAGSVVWTNNNNILLNGLGAVTRSGSVNGNDLASYSAANVIKDSGISALNPLFTTGGITTNVTGGTFYFTNGLLGKWTP